VRKKPENRLNRENWKKNNRKNRTEKKPIKFLKKPAGSVQFYNQKNRTEPTKNRKKPSQNGKNRAKPVWTGFFPKKPNRTETGRFDPVSVRFRFFFQKKKFGLVTFFDKNRTESKMITPSPLLIGKEIYFILYHYFMKERYELRWPKRSFLERTAF